MILSAIVVFSACSTTPTITPGKEDMLRNGKWKVASGELKARLPSGLDTTIDYVSFVYPSCNQDDYIVFDSQYHAAVFSGGTTCNPGDPVSIPFKWKFKNNQNSIDLYDGFNMLFAVSCNIEPLRFDTLEYDPFLRLDTILGVNDTLIGYTRTLIVLDSIWDATYTPVPSKGINIYDAAITDFTQSSFTLSYHLISQYPDTTNHNGNTPIYKPDTLHYKIRYTNF
jgi:hypothetical protein